MPRAALKLFSGVGDDRLGVVVIDWDACLVGVYTDLGVRVLQRIVRAPFLSVRWGEYPNGKRFRASKSPGMYHKFLSDCHEAMMKHFKYTESVAGPSPVDSISPRSRWDPRATVKGIIVGGAHWMREMFMESAYFDPFLKARVLAEVTRESLCSEVVCMQQAVNLVYYEMGLTMTKAVVSTPSPRAKRSESGGLPAGGMCECVIA